MRASGSVMICFIPPEMSSVLRRSNSSSAVVSLAVSGSDMMGI